jgi:hypothetical protein
MQPLQPSHTGDPYFGVAPILDGAVEWLKARQPESAPTLGALEQARRSPGWRLSVERRFGAVYGVSLIGAGGEWFLDAADERAALTLALFAVRNPRRPRVLICSPRVRDWLRPVQDRFGL